MQKRSSTNFPSFRPLDLLTLFWVRAGHLRNLELLGPPVAVVGERWVLDWSSMESETWAPDRLSTESEMWEHWATFVSVALSSVRERTGWVEARDLEGWEGVAFPGSVTLTGWTELIAFHCVDILSIMHTFNQQ